ncbi:MAG: nucleotidyltransferase family protein [Chloroflexaceae bacterium]|nr:nucleotidyltransferase family protein [Chloroflexaceae bacterium]
MTANTIPEIWPVADHIATLRYHLPDLSRQYHIKSLGVFGSYVRNEQTPQSDLDVLVEFDHVPSLFTYVEIQETLSCLVGVPIDLVHRPDLKPHIREGILKEVVMV